MDSLHFLTSTSTKKQNKDELKPEEETDASIMKQAQEHFTTSRTKLTNRTAENIEMVKNTEQNETFCSFT